MVRLQARQMPTGISGITSVTQWFVDTFNLAMNSLRRGEFVELLLDER